MLKLWMRLAFEIQRERSLRSDDECLAMLGISTFVLRNLRDIFSLRYLRIALLVRFQLFRSQCELRIAQVQPKRWSSIGRFLEKEKQPMKFWADTHKNQGLGKS